MPGAGSYVAASYIFNVAPKDGTVLGIIARDAALGPLSGAAGARFDPFRLSWIGTPAKETNVCIAYHTAQVKTVQDLFDKQLILGDTGPGTGTRSYPKVLSELLGMKFKLVGGFPLLVRRLPGDGARRGRGHLRKPRQRQDPAAGLDPNQEDHDPVPRRRRAQPRAQGRALRARPRAQRRAEAGDRIPLCRPGHRPPVRGAAGPAARIG